MQEVDALAQAVEQLPDEPSELGSKIGGLLESINAVEQKWDVREDMLKGLD